LQDEEIKGRIQTILVHHFGLAQNDFQWDAPLSHLNKDFEILGVLLELEHLINEYFHEKISLLNHIDPTFNTPKDIGKLIKETRSIG